MGSSDISWSLAGAVVSAAGARSLSWISLAGVLRGGCLLLSWLELWSAIFGVGLIFFRGGGGEACVGGRGAAVAVVAATVTTAVSGTVFFRCGWFPDDRLVRYQLSFQMVVVVGVLAAVVRLVLGVGVPNMTSSFPEW